MSVRPVKIPPLPKVASPAAWSWHYFRMRYLPMVASGLAVVMAVWLWAVNLPESTSVGHGPSVSGPVDTISNSAQAGALLSTNAADLQAATTNGNLGLGGGL